MEGASHSKTPNQYEDMVASSPGFCAGRMFVNVVIVGV